MEEVRIGYYTIQNPQGGIVNVSNSREHANTVNGFRQRKEEGPASERQSSNVQSGSGLDTNVPPESLPSEIESGSLRSLLQLTRYCSASSRKDASPFESVVKEYNHRLEHLNLLGVRLEKCLDPEKELKIRKSIKSYYAQTLKFANKIFSFLSENIGWKQKEFDKKKFDSAMEKCFGSLDSKGTNEFCYGGKTIAVHDLGSANIVFSLYLSRKCLVPANPLDKEKQLSAFFDRVMSVPPRTDVTPRAIKLLEKIAGSLFSETDDSNLKAPLHDAACVELKKNDGGKRQAHYIDKIEPRITEVIPKVLYTGGKLRTITVDSHYNLKYAFLNKYMQNQIRKCSWSLFGRSAEKQFSRKCMKSFLKKKFFLSGDLESATDLFNGELTEVVLKQLYETWKEKMGWSEFDYVQMCRFTTRAEFKLVGLQTRGQLMGSVLSFCILCLISLVAGILDTHHEKKILALSGSALHKYIERSICDVVINGDDIVIATDDERRGEKWIAGVEAIGGKVSRGKSLWSDHMFTVNSEMLFRDDTGWNMPSAFRPSLILALAGEIKFPMDAWVEYTKTPQYGLGLDRLFNVTEKLFLDIPTSLGGLGKVRRFNPIRMSAALTRRNMKTSSPWIDGTPDLLKAYRETPAGIAQKILRDEYKESKIYRVVTKETRKELLKLIYDTPPHIASWTNGSPMKLKDYEPSFMTHTETEQLREYYHLLFDLEDSGLANVKWAAGFNDLDVISFGNPALQPVFQGARFDISDWLLDQLSDFEELHPPTTTKRLFKTKLVDVSKHNRPARIKKMFAMIKNRKQLFRNWHGGEV